MSSAPDPVVIAVDMGSSGVRAAAVDRQGTIRAQSSVQSSTITGDDGSSVHRTEEVWQAVVTTIRQVVGDHSPDAVVLGGTAHALITGTPDDPDPEIVLWSDTRSARAHKQLVDDGFFTYSGLTACPSHAAYWPAKVAWLRNTGHLSPSRNHLFSEKDLVLHRLTGQAVSDTATAGATGLLDAHRLDWSAEVIGRVGAPWLALPPVEPATSSRPLDGLGSAALGLPTGTPIVLGGVDGPLAHLGVSGTEDGLASLTIGTSLGVRMHAPAARIDAQGRCWSYALTADHWIVGGAGSNGGNLLCWVQKALFDGQVGVEEIIEQALALTPDRSLVFLPYLNGERAPLWRSDLSGGFLGLRPRHNRWHMARAVLDSIGCMISELSSAVFSVAGGARLAGLNGGFTASSGWAQLATDAIGCPSRLPRNDAAVLRGAAAVAWAAVDDQPIKAAPDNVGDLLTPDPATHAAIDRATSRLAAMRAALQPFTDSQGSYDEIP